MVSTPRSSRSSGRRVDAQGELYSPPAGLAYVWALLAVLTALEAAHELRLISGPSALYELWFHDVVLGAAAVLVLARAAFEPTARRAWLAFGLAMALWFVGSISWSIVYGSRSPAPYPTFADILWLLWYPLMVVGIVTLIRVRFDRFELHRWMDGIAVTLLVLVAGFALVVQPVAEESSQGWLATIVDFSYPVLDILLIGAVLGVYGLLAWKPDGMWIFIGIGVSSMAVADAAFAVQQARGVADTGHYDFVWTIGALLIAYAAWVRTTTGPPVVDRVVGMRAVALALIAQALAGSIQIYAFFREVGRSERVVTLVVLVVASVQIVLTRPRAEPAETTDSNRARPEPADGSSEPSEP
ncbi:MAG TPA: hypothetical protein VHW93_05275 [Acidimicrobiales bacterium]|jgi:hypothetical protein|nr:hypothetical protein [Acidimicrobiales bacterium]